MHRSPEYVVKLPLIGWRTGHVQELSGGTPGRSPPLCPTACAIGRGGADSFTASTLLGRLGHAARICCRDRAMSCPGMSSRTLDGFEHFLGDLWWHRVRGDDFVADAVGASQRDRPSVAITCDISGWKDRHSTVSQLDVTLASRWIDAKDDARTDRLSSA